MLRFAVELWLPAVTYAGTMLDGAGKAAAAQPGKDSRVSSGEDGSHQGSTGSPGGGAAAVPVDPSDSPRALSTTQQPPAVNAVHEAAVQSSAEPVRQSAAQGLGVQNPGTRASLALESLREVAAGQRLGRLVMPQMGAEGAQSGVQTQPNATEADGTEDGPRAETGFKALEDIASRTEAGLEDLSAQSPLEAVQLDGAITAQLQPMQMQPSPPVNAVPSGNPFSSLVSAVRQAPGSIPQAGARPAYHAATMEQHMVVAAVAGLSIDEVKEAVPVAAVDSPAGGSTPAAKRGRFATPVRPQLISAEVLAEAAIRAATAALERVGGQRPLRNAGACLTSLYSLTWLWVRRVRCYI